MTRVLLRLACVTALAACADGSPTAARTPPLSPHGGTLLSVFDCSATVASGEVRCVQARPRGDVRGDLILGGSYVKLTSRNVSYDGVAELFAFEVAVRNLLPQPIGTTDGVTVDPSGIRVFFQSGPSVTSGSGTIDVLADGFGTFTASNQPYYQYDEILGDSVQSSWKAWAFSVPSSVVSFAFTLYVNAPVQYPAGWVTVSPGGMSLGVSSTQQLSAVVYNAYGNVVPGTISWTSSGPSVATVDASGLVTAVSTGQATITATSGSRVGTAQVTVS